jgi:hypothetical protein
MRAMVLEDRRYIQETRSIKAKRMLDEIAEIDHLADLASGKDADNDSRDPRSRGEKRKITTADKDMLNMKFKAAQMRRELLNLSAATENAEEIDAINIFFVPVTSEEVLKMRTVEIYEGSEDADMEDLMGTKEEVPEGTSGKLRIKAKTKKPAGPAYREHDDGTVEEM